MKASIVRGMRLGVLATTDITAQVDADQPERRALALIVMPISTLMRNSCYR